MTLKVNLVPELEARLLAEARARGVSVEQVAELLLLEAVASMPAYRPSNLSPEAFEAVLDEMSRGSEDLPNLPTESFSRASFYEGRP